jgi:hypothetical protein
MYIHTYYATTRGTKRLPEQGYPFFLRSDNNIINSRQAATTYDMYVLQIPFSALSITTVYLVIEMRTAQKAVRDEKIDTRDCRPRRPVYYVAS